MNIDPVDGAAELQLTLQEAVPLCTVTVLTLLARAGIRCLAIKGPAFIELGIRQPRSSNDVDVIVDPGRFIEAEQILSGFGWREWLEGVLRDVDTVHSITLAHPLWPCTLDLHHHFPGILRRPEEAFEVMWEGRTSVTLSHQAVLVPNRPTSVAIELLHALRGVDTDMLKPLASAILNAMPVPLSVAEQEMIVRDTPRLGTAHSLAPALEAMGAAVLGDGDEDSTMRAQWEHFARFGTVGSGWLGALNWRRPLHSTKVLFHHAWLTEEGARRWAGSRGLAYRGRLSVLSTRVRRGLASLRRP